MSEALQKRTTVKGWHGDELSGRLTSIRPFFKPLGVWSRVELAMHVVEHPERWYASREGENKSGFCNGDISPVL
jgi:hypothetical protein